MNYTPAKRFQFTLWIDESRTGKALHLEFDSREEAERAFQKCTADGTYSAGILYEWDKHHKEWNLLSRYPN